MIPGLFSRVASSLRYWGLRDSRGGHCSYGASAADIRLVSAVEDLPLRVNGVFSCATSDITLGEQAVQPRDCPACRVLSYD